MTFLPFMILESTVNRVDRIRNQDDIVVVEQLGNIAGIAFGTNGDEISAASTGDTPLRA